jgi:O-methyltransferase
MPPKIKLCLKLALARFLYRYPPILPPERLYAWLDAIWKTREIPGAVVEIGCSIGFTSTVASRMMSGAGVSKSYVCYDTFGGFLSEQFMKDVEIGTRPMVRENFSANSITLARKILRQQGANNVELIKGDIVALPADSLPKTISTALVDVDLSEPTRVALTKVWSRLASGGIVLVDDCLPDPSSSDWKAKIGYQAFCNEHKLPEAYRFNMGVLEKTV